MEIKKLRPKAILLSILLFVGNLLAMAETIEVNFDGVNYRLSDEDMTAMVINEIGSVGEDIWEKTWVEGDVVLPESINYARKTYVLTSIGDYAFRDCSNITSIKIPFSVTSIGDGAFEDCRNLTSIEIPFGVTSIGNNAFSGCI